jgi:hypothetical protein
MDCNGIGVSFAADPANLYSLNGPGYRFVYHCPPGLDCAAAPYLFLQCCDQLVFVDLQGVVEPQRSQKINAALARCTRMWGFCRQIPPGDGGGPHGPGPGGGTDPDPVVNIYFSPPACCRTECIGGVIGQYCLPGGTVASPASAAAAFALASSIACQQVAAGKVIIGNSQQCYTAACGGGDPFTAERCVPANQYGECLFFPTPAQVQAAQAFYDQVALDEATAAANAALAEHGCLVCNEAIHTFGACPGNPAIVVDVDIPAGMFCQPSGSPQEYVDSLANAEAVNQVAAKLKAAGCGCQTSVGGSARTQAVSTVGVCDPCWDMYYNGVPFQIPHVCASTFAAFGGNPDTWRVNIVDGNHFNPPPGTLLLQPNNYTGPPIKFYYP